MFTQDLPRSLESACGFLGLRGGRLSLWVCDGGLCAISLDARQSYRSVRLVRSFRESFSCTIVGFVGFTVFAWWGLDAAFGGFRLVFRADFLGPQERRTLPQLLLVL